MTVKYNTGADNLRKSYDKFSTPQRNQVSPDKDFMNNSELRGLNRTSEPHPSPFTTSSRKRDDFRFQAKLDEEADKVHSWFTNLDSDA